MKTLILFTSIFVLSFNQSAFAQEAKKSSETCVIYDYRPSLKQGLKLSKNIFAIEIKNANGGSFAKTYPNSPKITETVSTQNLEDATKPQFQKVERDAKNFIDSGKCNKLEYFYPSKEKEESDL